MVEIARIEVGQSYSVPGIVTALWPNGPAEFRAVLGPPHHDREYIKSRGRHLHFDVRFLSDDTLASVGLSAQDMMCKIKTVGGNIPDVIQREAICYREMPEFPSWKAPWAGALAAGYKNRWLKPGKLCPHQGICLAGLPQDADGNVTCPGHGLRWSLETGMAAP